MFHQSSCLFQVQNAQWACHHYGSHWLLHYRHHDSAWKRWVQAHLSTNTEYTTMCHVPYHEAVGLLMYTSLTTCPDISYAVTTTSGFLNNPGMPHWEAIRRINCYLLGTKDLRLTYRGAKWGHVAVITHWRAVWAIWWANHVKDLCQSVSYRILKQSSDHTCTNHIDIHFHFIHWVKQKDPLDLLPYCQYGRQNLDEGPSISESEAFCCQTWSTSDCWNWQVIHSSHTLQIDASILVMRTAY